MQQLAMSFDDVIVEPIIETEQVEDVTREQLLDTLECLVKAVDAQSDLPEYIDGGLSVCGLLRLQDIPRTEYICRDCFGSHTGYARRHNSDELGLAQMIFGVLISLTWFSHLFKLRAWPDGAVIDHATDIANRYYKNHPVWIKEIEHQGRDNAKSYLFSFPKECETKEQFEKLKQDTLRCALEQGRITQEQKETWIKGWDSAWEGL